MGGNYRGGNRNNFRGGNRGHRGGPRGGRGGNRNFGNSGGRRDNNSKTQWQTQERLSEPDAGICQFISDIPGFEGVIKSR